MSASMSNLGAIGSNVHSQDDIDEFLSTTLYGLLKCPDEDSVSERLDPEELRNKIQNFANNQVELMEVLENEPHITPIRSVKTGATLLHCCASNNAQRLGNQLISSVNDRIFDNSEPKTGDGLGSPAPAKGSIRDRMMNGTSPSSPSRSPGGKSPKSRPGKSGWGDVLGSPNHKGKAMGGGRLADAVSNSKNKVGPGGGGESPGGKKRETSKGSGAGGASKEASGSQSPKRGGKKNGIQTEVVKAEMNMSMGPGGGRKKPEPEIVKTKENYDPFGPDFIDLVEHPDVSGMTPLHYAAFEGKTDFIDLLLDSGADILAQDQLGQTPLHWAVQGGEHETCALLLQWERGTLALCLSDKLGQTPTDIARLYDRKYLHIRNGRSLLEVLAREYTNIKIPSISYNTRIDKKAGFFRNYPDALPQDPSFTHIKITKPIMKSGKKGGRSAFVDLDGPWVP